METAIATVSTCDALSRLLNFGPNFAEESRTHGQAAYRLHHLREIKALVVPASQEKHRLL